MGRMAFGDAPAPCPGLVQEHGRFWCGLVVLEEARGDEPLFARTLAVGAGCDSETEEEMSRG